MISKRMGTLQSTSKSCSKSPSTAGSELAIAQDVFQGGRMLGYLPSGWNTNITSHHINHFELLFLKMYRIFHCELFPKKLRNNFLSFFAFSLGPLCTSACKARPNRLKLGLKQQFRCGIAALCTSLSCQEDLGATLFLGTMVCFCIMHAAMGHRSPAPCDPLFLRGPLPSGLLRMG